MIRGAMPTKKPKFTFPVHDKDDYERVANLLRKEYKSLNEGLRDLLNAWLRKRGEEPLKELEWGGNRTGTKAGRKPKKK